MPLLTKKQDSAIIWEPRVKIATNPKSNTTSPPGLLYIVYAQLGGVLEQRGLLHKAVALFVFCIVLRTKIKEPQP